MVNFGRFCFVSKSFIHNYSFILPKLHEIFAEGVWNMAVELANTLLKEYMEIYNGPDLTAEKLSSLYCKDSRIFPNGKATVVGRDGNFSVFHCGHRLLHLWLKRTWMTFHKSNLYLIPSRLCFSHETGSLTWAFSPFLEPPQFCTFVGCTCIYFLSENSTSWENDRILQETDTRHETGCECWWCSLGWGLYHLLRGLQVHFRRQGGRWWNVRNCDFLFILVAGLKNHRTLRLSKNFVILFDLHFFFRFSGVYKKEDGKWKIFYDTGNPHAYWLRDNSPKHWRVFFTSGTIKPCSERGPWQINSEWKLCSSGNTLLCFVPTSSWNGIPVALERTQQTEWHPIWKFCTSASFCFFLEFFSEKRSRCRFMSLFELETGTTAKKTQVAPWMTDAMTKHHTGLRSAYQNPCSVFVFFLCRFFLVFLCLTSLST